MARLKLPLRHAPHVEVESRPGYYSAFGFQAVREAAREGRSATAGSGERHMLYDRERLVHQSRKFYRDNGIYSGAIDRTVAYVIGTGAALQVKTSNKRWNSQAEDLWREYWHRPEIRGVLSGSGVEETVLREQLICGDTAVVLTGPETGNLLQLVESEQVAGPSSCDNGTVVDDYGRLAALWISGYGKGGTVATTTARRYAVPDQVLFISAPDRPSSVRAFPPCQAAFPMLHRINDACDSEALAMQLLARIAVKVTRNQGAQIGFEESAEDAAAGDDELSQRVTEVGPALFFHANPGEDIEGVDRNIPGKDFPASLKMFLRLLGLPLGLPLEIMLLDWTNSNYSQSRAVIEQAFQGFLRRQIRMVDFFYQPVFAWKLRQWMAEGRLAPRELRRADTTWILPSFPWLDQLKEAQAWGARLDRGLATHTATLKSANMDRDEFLDIRKREVAEAIEIAQDLTARYGTPVPWQMFAGLEVSKTPAPAGDPSADPDNPTPEPEESEDGRDTPDDEPAAVEQ